MSVAFDKVWIVLKQNDWPRYQNPNVSATNPFGVETDSMGMPINVPEDHQIEQVPHPCPACGGSGQQMVWNIFNPIHRK